MRQVNTLTSCFKLPLIRLLLSKSISLHCLLLPLEHTFLLSHQMAKQAQTLTRYTIQYETKRDFIISNRDGNTIIKYMNYVPIVVATDLEVHFSVLKKGVVPILCLYSVCTSHWCLVMSFWLKVCIYSHTRGVKLGLGLGFMQTSQVLSH